MFAFFSKRKITIISSVSGVLDSPSPAPLLGIVAVQGLKHEHLQLGNGILMSLNKTRMGQCR
jgi:hypothetical protein